MYIYSKTPSYTIDQAYFQLRWAWQPNRKFFHCNILFRAVFPHQASSKIIEKLIRIINACKVQRRLAWTCTQFALFTFPTFQVIKQNRTNTSGSMIGHHCNKNNGDKTWFKNKNTIQSPSSCQEPQCIMGKVQTSSCYCRSGSSSVDGKERTRDTGKL